MSRRSSTSTPAVGSSRNRISGSCDERLGDQHAPLHAARQGDDLVVALVPQGQVAQGPLDDGRRGRLAEQAAGERDRGPDRFEGAGGQLLRDQADHAARGAKVAADVVAGDGDGAGRRVDDPADDADQRGLAGTVGAEQAEDLAFADLEVDRLQGHEAGGVGLAQAADGDDGGHASDAGCFDKEPPAAKVCRGGRNALAPMPRRRRPECRAPCAARRRRSRRTGGGR